LTHYLSLEDALIQVKAFGFYVKDPGLLEGALARPKTSVFGEATYPTIELKAASLMQSVIKNHPMIDGNKRSGWLLMVTFLLINGYEHNISVEVGFDLTLGVAEGRYELEAIAEIIQKHLVVRPIA
jgi:death-on-curing protein